MSTKKLRVVFVTMNEPFYIPIYMENIFKKLDNKIVEVVKVYALPPNIHKMNYPQTILYYLSYFGVPVFLYMVSLRFWYAVRTIINWHFKVNGILHSVKLTCKRYRIPFAPVNKINSKEVLNELKQLNPDIIFSVSAPQIFGKKLISIPSQGCLNIHSSLLPKYRGLNANFWVLAKGEKLTGVTIHYINPCIDEGDILLQKKIEIDIKWSLDDLYLKAIETGSDMIPKCLELIYTNKIQPKQNNISKGSYFSLPTKKDVKEFRSRGKRFFKYY